MSNFCFKCEIKGPILGSDFAALLKKTIIYVLYSESKDWGEI